MCRARSCLGWPKVPMVPTVGPQSLRIQARLWSHLLPSGDPISNVPLVGYIAGDAKQDSSSGAKVFALLATPLSPSSRMAPRAMKSLETATARSTG